MTAFVDMAMARSAAESLMTSTCRIYSTGTAVTDPDTGEVTYGEVDAVESPCRVRPNGNLVRDADAGGAEVVASGYVISLPFGGPTPSVFQRLKVLTSPDPSLVGLSLEIRQVARGDNITARRLLCEEVA